jgi:hypothetical protein
MRAAEGTPAQEFSHFQVHPWQRTILGDSTRELHLVEQLCHLRRVEVDADRAVDVRRGNLHRARREVWVQRLVAKRVCDLNGLNLKRHGAVPAI